MNETETFSWGSLTKCKLKFDFSTSLPVSSICLLCVCVCDLFVPVACICVCMFESVPVSLIMSVCDTELWFVFIGQHREFGNL